MNRLRSPRRWSSGRGASTSDGSMTKSFWGSRLFALALTASAAALLAGCEEDYQLSGGPGRSLTPIPADTVALMRGPLVLFALASAPHVVTKSQLLAARQSPERNDEWLVQTDSGTVRFRPFTSINDEPYLTYHHAL